MIRLMVLSAVAVGDADFQRARSVDRPGEYRRRRAFGDRDALARDRRLVDAALARRDHAVRGQPLARLDEDQVTRRQLLDRDDLLLTVDAA